MQNSSLHRILRLKTVLLALLLVVVGLSLLVAARVVSDRGGWLNLVPLGEVGSTLFVTGLLAVAWDYLDRRDREVRDDERVRRLLKESAPDFRDAVLAGFAADTEDLRRVATPEVLDGLATNAMALRLGDRGFAEEIYADVRDQAIRAPERWHDVDVSLRLSPAGERSGVPTPLFDVLVDWEYTTVPTHPVRRFACVSDRDEYDELMSDVPATLAWFMSSGGGLQANSMDSFELIYFSVDGDERPIRRSERKSAQTYTVPIGQDVVNAAKPVRIKHVYRVKVRAKSHYLFVELPQPAKNLAVRVDYSTTEIQRLSVVDLVTSARRPDVVQLPAQVDARVIDIDLRGWVLPRAGFTFVWSLLSESAEPASASRR